VQYSRDVAKSTETSVLGANRGIGFELARKLTFNGHQVFGTYRAAIVDDDTVQQVRSPTTAVRSLDPVASETPRNSFGCS
jgi:NAD(P)-dependent dehydrogenase (short-subunit alcohol dehydrogenase family)